MAVVDPWLEGGVEMKVGSGREVKREEDGGEGVLMRLIGGCGGWGNGVWCVGLWVVEGLVGGRGIDRGELGDVECTDPAEGKRLLAEAGIGEACMAGPWRERCVMVEWRGTGGAGGWGWW